MQMDKIIISLVVSWVLTVILEGAAACLVFRVRSWRDQFLLVLINTLTNPIAVLICTLTVEYTGISRTALIIPVEILVFLMEGLMLGKAMESASHPWIMSLTLNLFSFLTGQILNLTGQIHGFLLY